MACERQYKALSYLVDLLRINLNQTGNLIPFIIDNWARLEGIREKLITGEAALVDDHGRLRVTLQLYCQFVDVVGAHIEHSVDLIGSAWLCATGRLVRQERRTPVNRIVRVNCW